jgi:hypothetical protein
MIKPISLAMFSLLFVSQIASAQTAAAPKTAAECDALWTTADANADGKLDASEMEANKSMMPQVKPDASATTGSTATDPNKVDPNASAATSSDSAAGDTTGSTTPLDSGSAQAASMTKEAFSAACVTG